jgi:uncharacterized repeat protein (TIGR01451 family)/uncharacterized delta-60 repeat protein
MRRLQFAIGAISRFGIVPLGLVVWLGLAAESRAAAPANDNFANAQVITGIWGAITNDNTGATAEPGEPGHAGNAATASLWYRWIAPTSGEVTVDTLGSVDSTGAILDTLLAVYTGSTLSTLNQVAANDNLYAVQQQNQSSSYLTFPADPPFSVSIQQALPVQQPFAGPSTLRFNAQAGTTYYIAVDTRQATGPIALNWAFHASGVFRFASEDNVQGATAPVLLYTCAESESAPADTTTTATYYQYDPSGLLVTVTRVAGSSGRMTVDYATADITADAIPSTFAPFDRPAVGGQGPGTDYVPTSGTLVFDDFEMSKTIVIPITADGGLPDSNRVFSITLSNPQLAPEESTDVSPPRVDPTFGTAIVRIMDVDIDPNFIANFNFDTNMPPARPPVWTGPSNSVFNFAKAVFRVPEDVNDYYSTVSIKVSRTGTNTESVTLNYRINNTLGNNSENGEEKNNTFPLQPGSDYATPTPQNYGMLGTNSDFNLQEGTLNWGANDFQSKAIVLTITNDTITEFKEDFHIFLYRETQFGPVVVGMVNDACVSILFDDQDAPAGSVDEFYNVDHGFSMVPPVATNPQDLDHPGTDGAVFGLAVQPDNHTIVVGQFGSYDTIPRNGIARANTDGSLDASFDPHGGADDFISCISLFPSGRMLIGGAFTSFDGRQRNSVAQLDASGGLDLSFDPGLGANGVVWAIAQTNGQIYIAGDFTSYNGTNRNRIARLNADGSLDLTFDPGLNGPTNGAINAIVVTTSGKVLVGGQFTGVGGKYDHLARYNQNGSLDTTFNPGTSTDGAIYALAFQSTGKLLIGGEFTHFNLVPRSRIARLNTDGTLDTSFDPGIGADDAVYSLTPTTNNTIYVGGLFTSFNGTHRLSFARLFNDGTVDTSFLDASYNQFAGLHRKYFNSLSESRPAVNAAQEQSDGNVLIVGSFNQVGGGQASASIRVDPAFATDPNVWVEPKSRDGIRNRSNVARLIGGATPGPGNISLLYTNFSANKGQSYVNVGLIRSNGTLGRFSANFSVQPGLAQSGVDYSYYNVPPIYTETWNLANPANQPGVATRMHSDGLFGTNNIPTDIFGHFWFNYTLGQAIVSILNSGIAGNRDTQLQLANPSGSDLFYLGSENIPLGNALGRAIAPFTVVDDSQKTNYIGFISSSFTVNESATNAVITVIRTNGLAGTVTVQYSTLDGTGINNVNYRSVSGRLTFAPGVTNQTFTVPLIDDHAIEPNGLTVNLRLSGVTGATLFTNAAVLNLLDNDGAPGVVSFSAAAYSTNLSSGAVTLTVNRLGADKGTLTVQCTTTNGTAFAGTNYVALTNTLVWNDLDATPQYVTIPLIQDNKVGSNKTFQVYLYSPLVDTTNQPSVLTNPPTRVTVTIVNDNSYGILGFSTPTFQVNEAGGSATVNVIRTGGSAQNVTVHFATSDGSAISSGPFPNYVPTNGTLSFGAGEVAKSFTVPIINDGQLDPTPFFFTVTLSSPNPAGILSTQNVAIVNITDVQRTNVPAGSPDTAFLATPGFDGDVYGVALQPDGKIVAGGNFGYVNNYARNALARLNSDSTLDSSFLATGSGANGPVQTVLVQTDGRVLVGGNFTTMNGVSRNHVARVLSDGTLDTSFLSAGAAANNVVYAVAESFVGASRELLVGGSFTTVNGSPRAGLARLGNDGTLDSGFNPALSVNGTVYAIVVYPTNTIQAGKIMIAGDFTAINGVGRARIARLNTDGTLDTTFDPGLGATNTIRALALQLDGRVLAGGAFTNFNGQLMNHLVRLNTDGSIDTGFNLGLGMDDTVTAVGVEQDNRIVVVGQFLRASGVTRSRITRLLTDGTVDPSINFGAGADNYIGALAIQPDGMFVIGGGFTQFDGYGRQHLARIYGGSIAGSGSFEFTTGDFYADENGTNALITIRRRGGTAGAVSVGFSTTNRTAIAGINYSNTVATLSFPNGETFQNVLVPLRDDLQITPDLIADLGLYNPQPANGPVLGSQAFSRLNILNDDSSMSFDAATYLTSQNPVDGAASITILRMGSSRGTSSVDFFTTTNGTAVAGVDYTPVSNHVTFLQGQSNLTFKIPILNNPQSVNDVSVTMQLSNSFNTVLISPSSAVLTILTTNAVPGQFVFSQTNYFVGMGDGVANVTVVRTNGHSGVIKVNFATSDLTATNGVNYLGTNGILTFLNGDTSKRIGIPIIQLNHAVGNLSFNVNLSNPQGGATILNSSNAPVTIIDNNIGVGFGNSIYGAVETAGSVTLAVNRVGTNGTTQVSFATTNGTAIAGTNYQATSGTLTFNPGESVKTFNVNLLHDPRVTGDLSFTVNLFNPSAPAQLITSSATVVVFDSDPGILFTNAAFGVLKSATNVLITVLRSNANTGIVSINYATTNGTAIAPGDYTPTSGTLTFSNGIASQSFVVPIINNGLVQGDRTFYINLFTNSLSNGAQLLTPSTASVTITDDISGLSFSSPTYSAPENGAFANITVLRTGYTNSTVSVDYATSPGTAVAGVNYSNVSGTFTFTNGQMSQTFAVPLKDNSVVDGDKTVLLGLSNPQGRGQIINPGAATLTILESDGSQVVPSGTALIAESGPVNGVIDTNETVTLLFGLRSASGTNTVNLVATLLATNGITSPSGSQNYGALVVHGASVSKQFSFRAVGTNGQTITATFQLQDGATQLTNALFNFTLGRSISAYSNSAPIVINDHTNATPYPAVINVAGLNGVVSAATVTFTNLNHTWPADIDALLVSPTGQKSYLMAKSGGSFSVNNTTLTFDDSASSYLPQSSHIVSGTYKPTSYAAAPPPFPVPAPPPPYSTNLSVFNNFNPNGDWKLYILDDTAFNSGVISNGWALNLTIAGAVGGDSDAGVAMTAPSGSVPASSNLTYVLTVTNYGPATATNLVVTDTFPVGASYVSSSPGLGSVSTNGAGVATWTVGTLAKDATASLTLVLQLNQPGSATNTATVATTTNDPNPDNNTAIMVSSVVAATADLSLGLIGSPSPIFAGNTLTYTITVTNLGPGTAPAVAVTNTLPPGVQFISASPAAFVNGRVVSFPNLGNLGSGGQMTVTISAQPLVVGLITNTATCSSLVTDPLKANNTASVKTIVEGMTYSSTSTNLTISWPADVGAYHLESTPSLSAPITWTRVTSPPPVLVNGFYTVTIPTTSGKQYFRLRAGS